MCGADRLNFIYVETLWGIFSNKIKFRRRRAHNKKRTTPSKKAKREIEKKSYFVATPADLQSKFFLLSSAKPLWIARLLPRKMVK